MEVCNGIAYFERNISNNEFTACIGRKLHVANFASEESISPAKHAEGPKYVRSIGSTVLLNKSAHSLGRFDAFAVEVGPVEEAVLELGLRIKRDGCKLVLLHPMEVLFARSRQIAQRSYAMLKTAVLPFPTFLSQMQSRVPELIRESYQVASSFRIEIEIKKE